MSDEGEPAPARTIRVLIVDDHEVARVGLGALLAATADIRVVGEAAGAAEAVRQARALAPDIVVMDIRLPDASGVSACREIRAHRPSTAVLMLTSYSEPEVLFGAISAGAAGYVLKQTPGRELVAAIRTVFAGRSYLDAAVTGQVLERLRGAGPRAERDPLSVLTELERSILGLLAQGLTNSAIAASEHLSEASVKHYVSGILRKLRVTRRSQAAALWARGDGRGATAGAEATDPRRDPGPDRPNGPSPWSDGRTNQGRSAVLRDSRTTVR